jgi:serine phosphatase RsbU (regulator of sigma subunit)
LLHFRREAGERVTLDATTTPVGVLPFIDGTPGEPLEMEPGDVFFLASDGFFEWASPDEEEFGTDRVFDVLESNPDATAEEIIGLVREAVHEFARGVPQDDDLTAVVVMRSSAKTKPANE